MPPSDKNTRGSLSLSLSRGSWVLFDNPRTGSPSTKTSSNLAFWLSPRNARTGTPSNRARKFSNTALFLIRWLEEKRKRGKKMFSSFVRSWYFWLFYVQTDRQRERRFFFVVEKKRAKKDREIASSLERKLLFLDYWTYRF